MQTAELAEVPEAGVVRAPIDLAARCRKLVDDLSGALGASDDLATAEARDAVRTLVAGVIATPLEEKGKGDLVVQREIAALVSRGGDTMTVGAGARSGRNLTLRFPA